MSYPSPLGRPLTTALLATALCAGGLFISQAAQAESQGLYSADELLDADVYTRESADGNIGEVEDVLLDNDMRVRALVIDTGRLLDMQGQQQYVVETGKFTVETRNGDSLDTLEYRVTLDLSEEELASQPEYTDTWWNAATQSLQHAWTETREGAASAWETTQEGATQAMDRIGQALERVGQQVQEAADP